jgi:amino acid permease
MADLHDEEKHAPAYSAPAHMGDEKHISSGEDVGIVEGQGKLQRGLKGRHMQMIAM